MRPRRIVAFAVLGVGLSLVLLDGTLGALDVLSVSRQVDARALRHAMHVVDTNAGGLVHDAGVDLRFVHGRAQFATGTLGERRSDTSAVSGALTVLVVGDGAALGMWLEDALTFARLLERERTADGRAVHVVNGAHLFTDGVDRAALEHHWLGAVHPDVVLLCGPTVDRPELAVLRGIGAGAGQERSWLGSLFPSIWEIDRAFGGERPRDAEDAPVRQPAPARVAEFVAAAASCRSAGAVPIVVDLGGLDGLRDACAAAGVACATAGFDGQELRTRVFEEPTFGWPNQLGHARIRDKLVVDLVARGVLVRPR